jgi:hypothetical protein
MHHKMQLEHSNCLEKLFISVHSCSAYGTDWRVNAKFAASLFFFFSNLEAISRPFAKGVTGSSAFGTRRFLTGGSAQGVSGTGTEDVSDAGWRELTCCWYLTFCSSPVHSLGLTL